MRAGQSFYAHGKLLLSGEYVVLDGAKALALPTKFGQHLSVRYEKSYAPHLHWKGIDVEGKVWFEAAFELWKFDLMDSYRETPENLYLQKLLRAVREENSHFLREEETTVKVTTRLEFPLEWGLGSSSTLIYNMAQWAYISPFELQFKTMGGSGHDIACAHASAPILYEKNREGPLWEPISFRPPFSHKLYFVYLGNKQKTREGIDYYRGLHFAPKEKAELTLKISAITKEIPKARDLTDFEFLLKGHEVLLSESLKMKRVQELRFPDYWGVVKSLGSWGGDFVLVTSERGEEETRRYFLDKGCPLFFRYDEMIGVSSETGSGGEPIH
ncbi:MAG: GYDIA family GHMP kinase [Bacteriovoracales bacterium]|nr:GYDIA family GHMP kinase [Bacteriovoracales bacterium]